MIEILSGHTSPETAVIVEDYPYGFRLRCRIRYWLEFRPKHGFRLVSQITNPKRQGQSIGCDSNGDYWNKPKAGTYTYGLAVISLDNGHISYLTISYNNCSAADLSSFLEKHRSKLPMESIPETERYIRIKTEYAKQKGVRCRHEVAPGKACHCLCSQHDPRNGWIWCNKECQKYSHITRKKGKTYEKESL